MLFGSTPIEFTTDYSLEDSLRRLAAVTRAPRLFGSSEESAVGRVSAERIELVRVRPHINNSFKPVFTGRFVDDGAGLVLRGSFAVHRAVRVFVALWLVLLSAFTVILIAGRGFDAVGFLVVTAGMAVLMVAIVALGRWLSRDDPAWIADVVRQALTRA